ncbi:MAG: hypothetical protein U1F77_17880 [Kiritimatiellia bacterium]
MAVGRGHETRQPGGEFERGRVGEVAEDGMVEHGGLAGEGRDEFGAAVAGLTHHQLEMPSKTRLPSARVSHEPAAETTTGSGSSRRKEKRV